MQEATGGKFFTGVFQGIGAAPGSYAGGNRGLEVPLSTTVLRGTELDSKIDSWVEYGCMEADAGAAIKEVNQTPLADEILKGHCFVLIGAGSEMGPLRTLMQMGATVVGTGTRRASRWTRSSLFYAMLCNAMQCCRSKSTCASLISRMSYVLEKEKRR